MEIEREGLFFSFSFFSPPTPPVILFFLSFAAQLLLLVHILSSHTHCFTTLLPVMPKRNTLLLFHLICTVVVWVSCEAQLQDVHFGRKLFKSSQLSDLRPRHAAPERGLRRQEAQVPIQGNYASSVYYTTISLGTPPQYFTVQVRFFCSPCTLLCRALQHCRRYFPPPSHPTTTHNIHTLTHLTQLQLDTGSSDLGVPLRKCQGCAKQAQHYSPGISKTSKQVGCHSKEVTCALCSQSRGCSYNISYADKSGYSATVVGSKDLPNSKN